MVCMWFVCGLYVGILTSSLIHVYVIDSSAEGTCTMSKKVRKGLESCIYRPYNVLPAMSGKDVYIH